MAKIRRSGHDHQAPFCMFLLLFLLGIKRCRKAKTSFSMPNIPWTPNIFYRFIKPYQITSRGADQRLLDPPSLPYGGRGEGGGAKVIFLGL